MTQQRSCVLQLRPNAAEYIHNRDLGITHDDRDGSQLRLHLVNSLPTAEVCLYFHC